MVSFIGLHYMYKREDHIDENPYLIDAQMAGASLLIMKSANRRKKPPQKEGFFVGMNGNSFSEYTSPLIQMPNVW